MKITSVSFTKTLQTDAYTWHKVGLQADMEENDTPKEAVKELEKVVDEYFADLIPKPEKKSLLQKAKNNTSNVEDNYIQSIQGITDIAVLRSFGNLATDRYPKFKAEYEKNLKILTNE